MDGFSHHWHVFLLVCGGQLLGKLAMVSHGFVQGVKVVLFVFSSQMAIFLGLKLETEEKRFQKNRTLKVTKLANF